MVIFGPLFPYAFKNAKTGGSGSGGYQRSDEDPYSGPRSAKSRGSSAPQLSGNTILNSGNRGSYPSKEGGKSGFETYGYAYELDHHSSEGGDDVEREASDSDSGPIVIQHPDNKDSIPPGQAYTIPGPFGRRGSRNETPPQTRGTLGRNGKIYVESDVSVSVSHASTDRLEEREGKGYYSYSGSGLRNGAGRQYSISGGQSRGTSRDRTEQRIPASMGHDNSDPEDRDMGNEYYLRDIV